MPSERKRFSREFKLKIAQAYESGVSVGELTRQNDVHANLIYKWAREYRTNPEEAFRGSGSTTDNGQAAEQRIAELERVIGRLTVENDFLKRALQHAKSILANSPPKSTRA